MIRFEIDDVPESANKFMRRHWTQRKKLVDAWRVRIHMAIMTTAGMARAASVLWDQLDKKPRKLKVKITRCSPRLIDQANCWLGMDKLVLDSLVKLGLLVDDSPKWCEIEVKQEKGKARMVIVVEEM